MFRWRTTYEGTLSRGRGRSVGRPPRRDRAGARGTPASVRTPRVLERDGDEVGLVPAIAQLGDEPVGRDLRTPTDEGHGASRRRCAMPGAPWSSLSCLKCSRDRKPCRSPTSGSVKGHRGILAVVPVDLSRDLVGAAGSRRHRARSRSSSTAGGRPSAPAKAKRFAWLGKDRRAHGAASAHVARRSSLSRRGSRAVARAPEPDEAVAPLRRGRTGSSFPSRSVRR